MPHNNRLVNVKLYDSQGGSLTQEVEFGYDVLGNRIQKDVDADGDGNVDETTKFAYDLNGNAFLDLDAGGSLAMRRLYTNGVDALFAWIGQSGDEDWYLTDMLGSVRDIIDSDGDLQNHLDYSTWGAVTNESAPNYGDRYTWTGRERDVEIDLQYNRARYYDASTGRWISEDPIGRDAGDTNLYRYVANSPAASSDPTGLREVAFRLLMLKDVQGISTRLAAGKMPTTDEMHDLFFSYFAHRGYGPGASPAPKQGRRAMEAISSIFVRPGKGLENKIDKLLLAFLQKQLSIPALELSKADRETIDKLIMDLSDRLFMVREKASNGLVALYKNNSDAGLVIRHTLQQAMKHAELETLRRLEAVARKIDQDLDSADGRRQTTRQRLNAMLDSHRSVSFNAPGGKITENIHDLARVFIVETYDSERQRGQHVLDRFVASLKRSPFRLDRAFAAVMPGFPE